MKFCRLNDEHVAFNCPGCECGHLIRISGAHPCWDWNGDLVNPTLSPSIRVTYPANPDALEQFKEWRIERCCHSFVRDGKIEYCADSTHALAGQTVELPDWDDDCW
jgi:hypothetical protein